MKLKVTYLHKVLHKWKSHIPTIKQWTELFSETCKMQHKTQKYVWIIHSNVTEDVSYSFTPDFCNILLLFPHYSSATVEKPVILQLQLTGKTAFSPLNWLPPAELTSNALQGWKWSSRCSFSENQKYRMLSCEVILKYRSCKHQENIHLNTVHKSSKCFHSQAL